MVTRASLVLRKLNERNHIEIGKKFIFPNPVKGWEIEQEGEEIMITDKSTFTVADVDAQDSSRVIIANDITGNLYSVDIKLIP